MNLEKIVIRWKNIYTFIRDPSITVYLRNSILLNTIPKSGTNFLRMMITNYICNYHIVERNGLKAFQRVGYFEMDNHLFPNVRSDILNRSKKFKENNIDQKNLIYGRYSDFMYDHGHAIDFTVKFGLLFSFFFSKKMILLYRNPMDQIVSWFFYEYKNKQKKKYVELNESIEELAANYLRHYKRTMMLKKILSHQCHLVSYENLVMNPQNELIKIIEFLELPVNKELVTFCVNASSKKEVQKEEAMNVSTIHNQNLSSKSFIRSGKIGDWKNHINKKSYNKIEQILLRENIDLNEFTLE